MALEDVVNTGKKYAAIKTIAGNIRKDPYGPRNLGMFLAYSSQAGESLPDEELAVMQEDLSNNPFKLRQVAEISAEEEQGNLINKVSQNYKPVINDLPEEKLKNLAVGIPDKDKNFYEIIEKLQKGDVKGVRKAYAETFDNHVWKNFMKLADINLIQKYAARYIQLQQQKFLDNYTTELKVKGKAIKQLSANKLRDYITDTIEKYEEPEDKQRAYLALGELYLGIEDTEEERENERNQERPIMRRRARRATAA